jgi:hypothetical protein
MLRAALRRTFTGRVTNFTCSSAQLSNTPAKHVEQPDDDAQFTPILVDQVSPMAPNF